MEKEKDIYFYDSLVHHIPGFGKFVPYDREICISKPRLVYEYLGSWLNYQVNEGQPSKDVLKACQLLNEGSGTRYCREDFPGFLKTGLFFNLKYITIQRLKSYLSPDLLDRCKNYLQEIDGPNYKPF